MRLYRALLHLYPASFRTEYGPDMSQLFADRRRHAAGVLAVVTLWIEAILDTLRNAVLVHLDILRQDVRYAGRTLMRAPGFAATVVLVAGLGVGHGAVRSTTVKRAADEP